MKFIIFLVFAMLLCPLPISAANQFVKCVQEQLVVLGHNPGPIDGALGKRTRAALQKAVVDNPELDTLPRISNRYAVTWCRELAQGNFRTRSRMPFFDGMIVESDLVEESPIEQEIREQMRNLRIWYADRFGIRTASRPTIVIAQSGKSAIALGRKAGKQIGLRSIGSKSIRQKCDGPDDGTAGFAGPHIIYFCFTKLPNGGEVLSPEIARFLSIAIPHEYFHLVQYELAADKVARFYKKGSRPPAPHLRPSWLTEGSADYLAHLYTYRTVRRDAVIKWSFDVASGIKHKLRDIAKNRTLSNAEHYIVSMFAAHLLGERSGAGSVVKYWEKIGQGIKHDTAFEEAFGMTRKAFETEFEVLRSDYVKATDFIKRTSG